MFTVQLLFGVPFGAVLPDSRFSAPRYCDTTYRACRLTAPRPFTSPSDTARQPIEPPPWLQEAIQRQSVLELALGMGPSSVKQDDFIHRSTAISVS